MPGDVSRNHPMSDLDDWERALWDEYRRQSTTACCPRETIPDSCSCPDGCQCTCADCDCPRCWNCGTPYARRHEDGCDACDA